MTKADFVVHAAPKFAAPVEHGTSRTPANIREFDLASLKAPGFPTSLSQSSSKNASPAGILTLRSDADFQSARSSAGNAPMSSFHPAVADDVGHRLSFHAMDRHSSRDLDMLASQLGSTTIHDVSHFRCAFSYAHH